MKSIVLATLLAASCVVAGTACSAPKDCGSQTRAAADAEGNKKAAAAASKKANDAADEAEKNTRTDAAWLAASTKIIADATAAIAKDKQADEDLVKAKTELETCQK